MQLFTYFQTTYKNFVLFHTNPKVVVCKAVQTVFVCLSLSYKVWAIYLTINA